MTALYVPTSADPFYSQITDFDGIDFLLEFRYNQREDAWYFDISLADETKLVSGIKVEIGVDLLKRYADVRLPIGTLLAVESGNDDSTPGLLELGIGSRVTLVYVDAGGVVGG